MSTNQSPLNLSREQIITIGRKHFPKTTLSEAWFGFAADIAQALQHSIAAQKPVVELWCIHTPGLCEVHAAPSKAAAKHMATLHNAAVALHFKTHPPTLDGPCIKSTLATPTAWPHDPQSHAEALRSFDWAGWGLAAPAGGEG